MFLFRSSGLLLFDTRRFMSDLQRITTNDITIYKVDIENTIIFSGNHYYLGGTGFSLCENDASYPHSSVVFLKNIYDD